MGKQAQVWQKMQEAFFTHTKKGLFVRGSSFENLQWVDYVLKTIPWLEELTVIGCALVQKGKMCRIHAHQPYQAGKTLLVKPVVMQRRTMAGPSKVIHVHYA